MALTYMIQLFELSLRKQELLRLLLREQNVEYHDGWLVIANDGIRIRQEVLGDV